jgi:general secretion pathway protein C
MLARFAAFLVWALVAGSVVFWGLRLLVRAPAAPAHSIAVTGTSTTSADLTRLLGAAPVAAPAAAALAPDAAARFKLHGVMAPKGKPDAAPSGQGVALISVDGKPPRAFAIGSQLDSGVVLQSVSLRTASIGPASGAAFVKLELPPLPLPATGKLAPVAALMPEPAGVAAPVVPAPAMAAPMPVGPAAAGAPSRPPHSVAPRRDVNSR